MSKNKLAGVIAAAAAVAFMTAPVSSAVADTSNPQANGTDAQSQQGSNADNATQKDWKGSSKKPSGAKKKCWTPPPLPPTPCSNGCCMKDGTPKQKPKS